MKVKDRKKTRLFLPFLMGLIFILSLGFRTAAAGFVPMQTAVDLFTALRLLTAQIFNGQLYLERWNIIAGLPYYYESLSRLSTTIITCFGGMALALAGAAYQTIFKNPLASPNMLGVSAGVNLGNICYIFLFATQAGILLIYRYAFCYGFSFVIILFVLLMGRLAGLRVRRFSVLDMIVIGSVITHLSGVVVLYLQIQLQALDENLLLAYQQLSMGVTFYSDIISLAVFMTVVLLSMIPILLVRFRFNAVALQDDDSVTIGVKPGKMRLLGLAGGGILAMAALIHCGEAGMVAMVIPYVCRTIVGADFRKVAVYSMYLGGTLMMVCRLVSSQIIIYGQALPVNFLVTLVILPVFIMVMARQKRSAFE